MNVIFTRTGERRYAVHVEIVGKALQMMNPAPGFDPHIPHDLVHYVVEAELRLQHGVFGRAAKGGGTFIPAESGAEGARQRARQRRKQGRREAALHASDKSQELEMQRSERLAGACDLVWRKRQGQRPDPARFREPDPISSEDAASVERVVARLDELAPVWHRLPVGGALVFAWPSLVPSPG